MLFRSLGERTLSIAQITVGATSGLRAQSVRQVEEKFDASIVALVRGAEIDFHPAPDVSILDGDRLAVLASMEILRDVEAANA